MSDRRSWSDWFPETEQEYRERLRLAKQMTGAERMTEGFRMFEKECQMRRQAIREAHPDMTDEEVEQAIDAQTEAWYKIKDEQKRYAIEVLGLLP